MKRIGIAALAAAVMVPAPASAQFFYQPPALERGTVRGDEPGIGLPSATPLETEAALVWNLRAALNVAALQCGFAPTLLTETNYNAMLRDHDVELKRSFDTLGKYFTRVAKSKVAGQNALDRYGTRVYSGYSTVSGQYTFCMTANSVGRDAIFANRGGLAEVSRARLRELRASLLPGGNSAFGFRDADLDDAATSQPVGPVLEGHCVSGRQVRSGLSRASLLRGALTQAQQLVGLKR